MLGIIRRRSGLGRLRIRVSAAAHTAAAPIALPAKEEPYGQEYGAGPSRLPYQPPAPPHDVYHSVQSARRRRDGARALRRFLANEQTTGQYSSPELFSQYLRKANIPHLVDMSRLQLHTTVHHLVRIGRSTLALGIITEVIDAGATCHPTIRRVFSQRTLHTLLLAETARYDDWRNLRPSTTRGTLVKFPVLLDLLRALQSIRHRRPAQLYTLLVQMSISQRRPDKAAEIFVGLVEEWVTEGRVAEGADAEGFYEGGGPPRKMSEGMARRHKSWWTGVRTWTLPGEVISPHDRLDLWHPSKLSLRGKFKNFPTPLATSPPSMVPPPSARLLNPILASLRLDPTVASPADFEASMRACAYLANTVLSRTLPLTSLGPLLKTLEATPSQPPVYPEHLVKIPTADAWAYEAFTQIHLALQSFFFAPPISAASFAIARENESILSGNTPTMHADKYRLQPLGLGDAVILLKYALEKMRSTKILAKLLRYIKRTFNFGWTRPVMWNAVLSGATLMGDQRLAVVADDALFGETVLAREEGVKDREARKVEAAEMARRIPRPERTIHKVTEILLCDPDVAVQADEESIVLLVHHLGKTSQFDRLTALVYKLIPFLEENESTTSSPSSMLPDDAEANGSGRISPNHLTPDLYAAILSSLAMAGKTGLAQRVYTLALQAEQTWIENYIDDHPGAESLPIPLSLRLPLSVFSAMLRIWGNEVNRSNPDTYIHTPTRYTTSSYGRRPPIKYPLGWIPPHSLIGQPRNIAAGYMARAVYAQAASLFPPRNITFIRDTTFGPPVAPLTENGEYDTEATPPTQIYPPDAVFFSNAFRALALYLGFNRNTAGLTDRAQALFDQILRDMEMYRVNVPERLLDRAKAEYGTYVGRLQPADYAVYQAKVEQNQRAVRASKLRGLAEALLRADEEGGLWRDGNVVVGEKAGQMGGMEEGVKEKVEVV